MKEITAVLSLGTGVVGEINKALKASGWVSITPTINNLPMDLTAVWAASWAWKWLSFCVQTKPTTLHVETLFQPNRFHDWSMSLQSINQIHNSSDKSTISENHQGALKKPRDNVWKGAVPYMIKSTNQILSSTSAVSGIILPHNTCFSLRTKVENRWIGFDLTNYKLLFRKKKKSWNTVRKKEKNIFPKFKHKLADLLKRKREKKRHFKKCPTF